MNSGAKQLSIGMLGCGVVGSQVARLLQDDEQELSERSGAVLKLSRVGVRLSITDVYQRYANAARQQFYLNC